MKSHTDRILAQVLAGALVIALVLVAPAAAWGQQTQKISVETPAGKLTQQHGVDVGDAPGHQLRVSELHRVYDRNAPLIGGARLKESWHRGITDYVDLTGLAVVYATYILENGDRFFCRGNGTSQSVHTSGGKDASRFLASYFITDGTGKLQGIHGVVRIDGSSDFATGMNQAKTDIEYWFER